MIVIRLLSVLILLLIIALDQISKWVVMDWLIHATQSHDLSLPGFFAWLMQAGQERLPFFQQKITGFFNLVLVWNEGVSFGLFARGGAGHALLLAGFACIVSMIFFIWMLRTGRALVCLSLALVIGGALSNAWDRVRFGAVIDFLDFHVTGWHWPAFNIADSAIVIGIAILIVDSIFFDKDHERHEERAEPE